MGYIYKITNNINNKIYVGKTTTTIQNRFKEHIKKARANVGCFDSYFHKALIKYGIDNFTVEELDIADSLEELNQKEIYWIKTLDSTNGDIGYNQTIGGDGGDIFNQLTPERQQITRQKLSQSSSNRVWINNGLVDKQITKNEIIPDGFIQGRLPLSDETKKKMSESRRGRKLSPNTVAKIIQSKKEHGYIVSEETKQKLRDANLGKKYSDEVNRKKGRQKFGFNNPAYGTHYKWVTNGIIDKRVYEKDYYQLPEYYMNGYRDGRCNKSLFKLNEE